MQEKLLKYPYEIRDPVHGLIPLTELEFKIIDTMPMQRLRGIKQLALANLGFPGANHTRFEHCIGTLHVASKITQHLKNNEIINITNEEEQIIRLTGLLHDIGHGPFSHVSESVLDMYSKNKSENVEEIHEEISRQIITRNEEIKKILGEELALKISDVLKTNLSSLNYEHDIISGPLDCDKMDYLLRDSYYAGVKYGIFDIERLINVLSLVDEGPMKRLSIKHEGIQTVEQYVLAKYFIAQQVYQHKTRHITDIMLIEGIKNEIENDNKKLKFVYTYEESDKYLNKYLGYNDNKIFEEILNNSNHDSLSYKYFSMLDKRRLLKQLFNGKIDELVGERSRELTKRIQSIKEDKCDDLIKQINKDLSLEEHFTHIKVYSINDPLIQKSFEISEPEIIIKKNGNTNSLEDESILFKNIITKGINNISIFGLPNEELDDKKKENIKRKIKKMLEEYLGG